MKAFYEAKLTRLGLDYLLFDDKDMQDRAYIMTGCFLKMESVATGLIAAPEEWGHDNQMYLNALNKLAFSIDRRDYRLITPGLDRIQSQLKSDGVILMDHMHKLALDALNYLYESYYSSSKIRIKGVIDRIENKKTFLCKVI